MKNRMDVNQLSYTGSELEGKTIGIIGMGAIGKKAAKLCRAFDMNVLAYTRNAVVQSDDFVRMTDFDHLIRNSDIVTVHASLNQQTKHMFEAAQ